MASEIDFIGMFEECPADFSFLRMEETPPTGGDTMWCSGYELYVTAHETNVIYIADFFFLPSVL
jgi:alpha-ketoglutarate-dependent taurine dioxygenase